MSQSAIGQDNDVTGPPKGITLPSSSSSPSSDSSSDGSLQSITDRPGLSDGGIQVGTLSGIDAAGLGLIGLATGGFEQDLWEGSERLAIETLLPKLPVATRSGSMNALAHRLLLTTGPLPDGITRGTSFLALRLERLYVAGQIAEVIDLAARAPSLMDVADVARSRARAFLLSHNYESACELASGLAVARDEPFWLRLRIFCFVVAGENAAADLTADLLLEQNADDPSFFALVMRMTTGADIDIPVTDKFDALALAMYAELGLAPSDDALANAAPAVLSALALDDRFDLPLRLSSAEKAVRFGALSPEQLGILYDQIKFTAEDLSNALTLIGKLPPARGQALIYRMLKTLVVPSAFAEALRGATTLAVKNDSFFESARLYWPILRNIIPSEPYAEVATDIGRMALLNGNLTSAYEWFDVARQSTRSDSGKIRDLRILLAVGAPSDRLPWRSTDPLQWLDSVPPQSREFERLVRNIQILEGLGYPVSRDIQLMMLEAPLQRSVVQTSQVILARLNSATVAERLGEVVLLSLIAIGQGGPPTASHSDLLSAYGSLSAVGLDTEAKQIVLEAVLGVQLKGEAPSSL